jgi:hypothetical protein
VRWCATSRSAGIIVLFLLAVACAAPTSPARDANEAVESSQRPPTMPSSPQPSAASQGAGGAGELAWRGALPDEPRLPALPALPEPRQRVDRRTVGDSVYGGLGLVSVRGSWDGDFHLDVEDHRVTCLYIDHRTRWLVGSRLLGDSPAASDGGFSLQLDEVYGRVDEPTRPTGHSAQVTLRGKNGVIYEGATSRPPNVDELGIRVSKDRRQASVSFVAFVTPQFTAGADNPAGWVSVTAVVSCDGALPPLV